MEITDEEKRGRAKIFHEAIMKVYDKVRWQTIDDKGDAEKLGDIEHVIVIGSNRKGISTLHIGITSARVQQIVIQYLINELNERVKKEMMR